MSPATPLRIGVVLAGGHGERFWPVSQPDRPKQLLKLSGSGRTMLEDSIQRIGPIVSEVFVSTSVSLAGPLSQSHLLPAGNIFAEPARRGTLGAILWTVANLMARGLERSTVAVVTADHVIGDESRLREAISTAMTAAEQQGGLVTLGIRPTRPETGYGYIEMDRDSANKVGDLEVYRARSFREKPDAATATVYQTSGRHVWNSGMFFFTVPAFLGELQLVAPTLRSSLESLVKAIQEGDSAGASQVFDDLPDTSIDYALLEKAKNVRIIPADFPWDDVGAWDALGRTNSSDDNGNVIVGPALVVDATSSIVYNDDPDRPVALLGIEDLIVVNTSSAVLVCHRSQAQRVKQIAAMMAKKAES